MIDLDKKYITVNGCKVVALYHCPKNPEHARIIGLVQNDVGFVEAYEFYEDGMHLSQNSGDNDFDLIPAPKKVTRWFNIYSDKEGIALCGGLGYSSESRAKEHAGPMSSYIKTISVTVELDQ